MHIYTRFTLPDVSLVRRLMIRPSGFVWKKDIGALQGKQHQTSDILPEPP